MDPIIILAARYLYLVSIIVAIGVTLTSVAPARNRIALLAALALPLALLLAVVLGRFIYDPRPFMIDHLPALIPHAPGNGFPSDHTLLTMSIAAVIFVYHRWAGALLATIALSVGAARVLAHVHHPVDIAGSVAISIVATVVALMILRRIAPRVTARA